MNPDTFGYFAKREQSEIAAAQAAQSSEARRAHEELAQRYAALKAVRGVTGLATEERQTSMVLPAILILASK